MFRVDDSGEISNILSKSNKSSHDSPKSAQSSRSSSKSKKSEEGWKQSATSRLLLHVEKQRHKLLITFVFLAALVVIGLRFASKFNLRNWDGIIELTFCVLFVALTTCISVKLGEALQLYNIDESMRAIWAERRQAGVRACSSSVVVGGRGGGEHDGKDNN